MKFILALLISIVAIAVASERWLIPHCEHCSSRQLTVERLRVGYFVLARTHCTRCGWYDERWE